MKKILTVIVMLAMIITSTNVCSAYTPGNAATQTDQDVKIELLQNDTVVESGVNTLTHTRNYARSTTKTNGDEIVITAPEGVHYLMVQLDQYCGTPKTTGKAEQTQIEGTKKPSDLSSLEYGETLVYLMNGEFRYVIPGLSGTDASGTTLGGGNWPYDARAFATSGNTEKKITARVATQEEISERKNLALNPFDLKGNDSARSGANKKGDINVFPHAYANRVTDNKREFEPRNAIDGFEYNASHVGFPYQAWGCGNEKTDSEFSVLFGRYVDIDQIDITVRAQWNPPQPNNASDHDINWTSATLEFSDGTELPITLEKLASPQTIKLPEKKTVSWVRLKDLPVSEEIIPVDGRKKFSALTEFKVWGSEADEANIAMPSGESIVNLAKKVNDYWIKTGGNTGDDATNYNHGHSVTSEFWAPSVFYTGNMEAYFLTGDENYTDYANRWGSNNVYNDAAWNTKADSGRIGKYFPDNHTSFQTYLDMFSITSDTGFDAENEKIKNLVPIMNEMEQMSISDLKSKNGYWDRIDFFYMELPNWTKMYLLTGETKWLDKLRALYDDRKAELYDEATGLFYRDKNYIFDANATYNPDGDGNNQKISPNGKKILWSRGNGWAMAALAKVLQDLPDNRIADREEYEAVFKKMAATLIQVQGEDGFWRMNLDDENHDARPETSGTVFFAYGLAWGINHGLLDKETYYPAVRKAFLGLNANAIRPDGLVGRSELISAYPNPKCALGIGSSQSYAPAATVLFLSELSKLEQQGYVSDDVEPALNKKMIGSIAVKENSSYAVVNSRVRELVAGTELTTINQNGVVYVPKAFVKDVYGEATADQITDTATIAGADYVALAGILQEQDERILSSADNGISIVSYQKELLDPVLDAKLVTLLNTGLSKGAYPERPEYPIRFDYTEPVKQPEPSENALIAVQSNSAGAVSASRLIGPNTESTVNVEFDMVSVLSPGQTNAIVGIGNADSDYTAYSQVPIIIRMYKDGTFGVYNGTGYVQSNVKFTQNETYHIRTSIDLDNKTYSVFVTAPDQTEVKIADQFAFRSTAAAPSDIGKIYLFNNDQPAGKYWLENIYLGKQIEQLIPSEDALIATDANSSGAISVNREIGPSTKQPVNIEFDMVTLLSPDQTNAIVGIGSSNSNYTAYGQIPIIIRMFKDGSFGVYNKTGYVQSKVTFKDNVKYHLRASIDLQAKTYSVFVTAPEGEEQCIADQFAFRSTASLPSDIGKIYLFNNDQQAGKYWLEAISLGRETNKEYLEQILTEARAIQETGYTETSYQSLQEAIAAGEQILADAEATQDEIDQAEDAVQLAIQGLEKDQVAFFKTILKNTIDKADALTKSDQFRKLAPYVQVMIMTRLKEAVTAYDDAEATMEECQQAYKNLADALHYADFVADKTALQALIEECTAIVRDEYTPESVAVFEEALAAAKDVYEDQNALQERIDASYRALLTARNGLIELPVIEVDKQILSYIIEIVKEAVEYEDRYVHNTAWDEMISALAEAEIVLDDAEADQAAVDLATSRLTSAYENIRLLPDEALLKQLEDFIDYATSIDRTLYEAEDLKRVDEAVKIAQDMLDQKDFDEANFQAFAETMTIVMDIIDHNKKELPSEDDQKQETDNSVNTSPETKGADTSDATNTAGIMSICLLAGLGLIMLTKKQKQYGR